MLLIWGVLFEMSELRHLNFLFPVKEEHQQLFNCQGSVKVGESKCKLNYNCLVGHRGIGREGFREKRLSLLCDCCMLFFQLE